METKHCQSCAMPLTKPEEMGTNSDGSLNEEYCCYCYKDGALVVLCQSCGMPLADPEHLGTNADGTPSDEYCCYCYKDGAYAQDCTMEQMIEHCLKFIEDFNKDSPTVYTRDEALASMRAFFPTLKRWAVK